MRTDKGIGLEEGAVVRRHLGSVRKVLGAGHVDRAVAFLGREVVAGGDVGQRQHELTPFARGREAPGLLQRADLVVGFNNLRFDYEVLHGYTIFDLTQVPTLDMLVELQKVLQHRLSLDSIAAATLGLEKTSEGLQAIEWFRQGRMLEIAEYCCFDVKLTKLVHEYGATRKQLFYKNRFGAKLNVAVNW